ncbi:hypothetical protein niasHT_039178 [Heterodera trifolii]|uniref:Uncharacterized protein n=1 Tax=Heterodera trifolii TaxID=157864 RepID=A0ABD2IFZ1_9BILA
MRNPRARLNTIIVITRARFSDTSKGVRLCFDRTIILAGLTWGEKNRSKMVDIMAAIAFCNQMPTDAFLMAAHKLSAVAIYSETSMFSLQLCQLKIENSRLHMPNGSNYETKGGAQFCRNLSHPYGLWFYRA